MSLSRKPRHEFWIRTQDSRQTLQRHELRFSTRSSQSITATGFVAQISSIASDEISRLAAKGLGYVSKSSCLYALQQAPRSDTTIMASTGAARRGIVSAWRRVNNHPGQEVRARHDLAERVGICQKILRCAMKCHVATIFVSTAPALDVMRFFMQQELRAFSSGQLILFCRDVAPQEASFRAIEKDEQG